MVHPMTCGTCGDPSNMTACAGCARRDLEGMRSFQTKFMKADHERRELELQVERMRMMLNDIRGMAMLTGGELAAQVIHRIECQDPTCPEKLKCANEKEKA